MASVLKSKDLIVPFSTRFTRESDDDFFPTLASLISFVAMFLKSRPLAWLAVYMASSAAMTSRDGKNTLMGISISLVAVLTTYMDLFIPVPINSSD